MRNIKTMNVKSGEMAEYLSSEITKNPDGTYKVVHYFLNENFGKIKVEYHRVKIEIDITLDIFYPFRNPNIFPFKFEVLQKSDEDGTLFSLQQEE